MTSMVGFLAETAEETVVAAVETVVANEVLGVVEDSEAPRVGAVAILSMKMMDLGAVKVTEDLTIVGQGLGVLEAPATIGLLEVEKLTVDGLRVQAGLHPGTGIFPLPCINLLLFSLFLVPILVLFLSPSTYVVENKIASFKARGIVKVIISRLAMIRVERVHP